MTSKTVQYNFDTMIVPLHENPEQYQLLEKSEKCHVRYTSSLKLPIRVTKFIRIFLSRSIQFFVSRFSLSFWLGRNAILHLWLIHVWIGLSVFGRRCIRIKSPGIVLGPYFHLTQCLPRYHLLATPLNFEISATDRTKFHTTRHITSSTDSDLWSTRNTRSCKFPPVS